MNTVNELIHRSVGSLRNNSISTANFAKPHYPTCVFYYGKRSALYHQALLEDLARGWGGNADYIKFYVVEDPESDTVTDVQSGETLTAADVKAQITELLTAQNAFADMTRIALYGMVDTTEIKSAEEFEKWYLLIRFLKDLVGVSTLSMLMVILNESLQLTEAAKGITNKLRDLYQDASLGGENTHLYDSVFVLGNRLRNGSFVKIDPTTTEYENYNLFADVILLANTRDIDYNMRRAQLYGSEKPAITAAYGFVQKPMAEIVMISLSIIVNKLRELLHSQALEAEHLMAALEISNGRSAVYEKFYADIKELLPSADFLNWLPGKPDSVALFDELNRVTDGCLQMFVTQNHLEIVKAELLDRRDHVERELIGLLSRSLNAAQLANGVSNEIKNTVFSKAEIALSEPDRLPILPAIEMKVKKEIALRMREIAVDAIAAAVERAQACLDCFRQLCSELERMVSVGEEGTRKNLTAFYGDKINRYFNDANKLKALFRRILTLGNGKAEMLEILLGELELLFESDPVYKLSFSEELIERLGAVDTAKRAQTFIGEELIKNLDERVSYYSKHIFRVRVFEAYLLNTDGTNNNLLFKYLSDREVPPEVSRTFFNTCNNDMAESIWFYLCSVDNLTL